MAVIERRELKPGIVELRLNRPERLNAITFELLNSLIEHIDAIERDDSVRVVVITGEGRGFCAGADLKGDPASRSTIPEGFTRPGVIGMLRQTEWYAEAVVRMHRLDKPIIAAVNGPATGGGLAFVLGADIRIAAESARFAASFVKAGLSGCDMGVSWLLPRVVGAGNAHQLMLTGRIIDARRALDIGLVVDVVPDDQLHARVLEEAELILGNTPWGVEMTKRVMWDNLETPSLTAAISLEARTQTLTTTTADNREAMTAWVERRPPTFDLA